MKNAKKNVNAAPGHALKALACGAFALFFALFFARPAARAAADPPDGEPVLFIDGEDDGAYAPILPIDEAAAENTAAETDTLDIGLYSVNMTWGAMSFVYDRDGASWRIYDIYGQRMLDETETDFNRIEVTNDSTVAGDVTVTLAYCAAGEEDVAGLFTVEWGTAVLENTGSAVTMRLGSPGTPEGTGVVYFMPCGVTDSVLENDSSLKLGSITVSIRPFDEEDEEEEEEESEEPEDEEPETDEQSGGTPMPLPTLTPWPLATATPAPTATPLPDDPDDPFIIPDAPDAPEPYEPEPDYHEPEPEPEYTPEESPAEQETDE